MHDSSTTGGHRPWINALLIVLTMAVLLVLPATNAGQVGRPAAADDGENAQPSSEPVAPPRVQGRTFRLTRAAQVADDGGEVAGAEPAAPPPAANGALDGVLIGDQVDAENVEISELPIRMNFRGAPVDEVLEYLSEKAGLVVIKTIEVEGTITVFSRKDMTVPEAITVLNSILKEMGYAAILLDRTLKIVAFADASKESIPVFVGADPKKIAKTDEMITQVIPLQHTDAEQLVDNLDPLLPSYAVLEANVRSNSLLITDTSANIRRIVEIVQSLDQNLANEVTVRVFPLEYANADETADLINDVFDSSDRTRDRGSSRGGGGSWDDRRREFFMRMSGRGGVSAGTRASGSSRPQIPVDAVPEERTNSVVVTGPEDMLELVEAIIKELDSDPIGQMSVFIYKVKNGSALQLADTLNNLFDGNINQSTTGSRGSTRNTGTQRSSGRGGSTFGSNAASNLSRSGTFGTAGGGSSSGRSSSGGRSSRSGTSALANSDLTGQVDVVAEEDTNSLIVMTPDKNLQRVKEIILELDRTVPQVYIKVLIAEVTHTNEKELGVEWSVLDEAEDAGEALFTDFGVADLTGGLIFKLAKSDIRATVRALERTGKLNVLSRPYILAHENQEANITVGQEVPFIRRSRVSDSGQVSSDVEYEDIGIILTVIPHINPDGLVVMDVAPEISTITDSSVQISESINAPIFSKRSAYGRVAVADGKTVVIGGLMEDSYEEVVNKVPLLGDIPILGELFKSRSKDKGKTELLIFLTPHVVTSQERLEKFTEQEKAGTMIVPNAVEEGMFESHMRGMERGAPWLDLDKQMNGNGNTGEGNGTNGNGRIEIDPIDPVDPVEPQPNDIEPLDENAWKPKTDADEMVIVPVGEARQERETTPVKHIADEQQKVLFEPKNEYERAMIEQMLRARAERNALAQ